MKQEYLDAKLERYRQKEIYPFHMPGHKRKEHALMDPYSMDITEIEGFDNLHEPDPVRRQGTVSRVIWSKREFFLSKRKYLRTVSSDQCRHKEGRYHTDGKKLS